MGHLANIVPGVDPEEGRSHVCTAQWKRFPVVR